MMLLDAFFTFWMLLIFYMMLFDAFSRFECSGFFIECLGCLMPYTHLSFLRNNGSRASRRPVGWPTIRACHFEGF